MPIPTCPARIRPFRPLHDLEVACESHLGHEHAHLGTIRDYAYPGSSTSLTWLDTDRRNFTGDFLECPVAGCILPAGHR